MARAQGGKRACTKQLHLKQPDTLDLARLLLPFSEGGTLHRDRAEFCIRNSFVAPALPVPVRQHAQICSEVQHDVPADLEPLGGLTPTKEYVWSAAKITSCSNM